jgi:DNA (cytosine-5)-methyltransferase 1
VVPFLTCFHKYIAQTVLGLISLQIYTIDVPNAVYQMRRVYVRKNKSGLIPTLTANMGTGGNNVPIVKTKHGIRKLTPRECLNAQGFPRDFVLPEVLSDSRLYKMAGNSVCVPVVRRIAENIAKAIIP